MTDQTSNEMHTIDQIARTLMGSLSSGWREVTVTYQATAPYAELDATVTGSDVQQVQLDPLPEGLEEHFETLRLQMYQRGKGAWLTAMVTITAEGRFSTDFDYENEPTWSIPVNPETYAADWRSSHAIFGTSLTGCRTRSLAGERLGLTGCG